MYSKANGALRGLGRAVTAVGLLLFWVRVLVLAFSEGDPVPAALGQTGFVLAAAGCLGTAGIVGMLFQTVFAFIFGTLLIWFTKPYRYLIVLFKRIKDKYLGGNNDRSEE